MDTQYECKLMSIIVYLQAVTSGYYYHTSVLSKGGYKTVKHQQVYTLYFIH